MPGPAAQWQHMGCCACAASRQACQAQQLTLPTLDLRALTGTARVMHCDSSMELLPGSSQPVPACVLGTCRRQMVYT